ncbi:unnamed protein product [Leptosia nina]|uniref:VWFC domain-containing protein n=1 Tax=Leptosia nina TaxID=320188 RepID=A0AAV1JVR8_9NEOP
MYRLKGDMCSPRYCVYLLVALHSTLSKAGPVGPLPNITSLDLGLKEGSCALGDVVYMSGDEFPGANACERCACAGGEVRCEKQQCEPRPGCKAVHRPDHCCPTYQCECEQEGRVYGNGEKLVDPQDPCRVCYCQGGEVVCRRIACFVRDDCQPRLVPGRCCPEYDNCPLRGVTSVHGATATSAPSSKVNTSAAASPPVLVKPGFTIKEITPVSEIPVITDVKVKEILPSPNVDEAEYSSSKSPLIPREVTSENPLSGDANAKLDSTSSVDKSDIKTSIEENPNVKDGTDSSPSKISFSTQDSINSDIYPSNIPNLIMMGSPSEPIGLSPLTSKIPGIEEEDPTLFDHNPAFPPIPDDLSVLGNHEDEILPEQHFDNEHVPGISNADVTNEQIATESPVAKASPTTVLFMSSDISVTTENLLDPEISTRRTNKIEASTPLTFTTKDNTMINLRSAIPTEILNIPSFISDDTTVDDMDTTTEVPNQEITSMAHDEIPKEENVTLQNKYNETNLSDPIPQTTENIVTQKVSEISSTEIFSENQPSSILIETSDQNPHDVSEKGLESTLASSTTSALTSELLVSDSIILSRMDPSKDTSFENMETTEFIPFGSQESATDAVELIKISPDNERSSALIEPPRGKKNNVLTDLINLVGDVASISDHTDAPQYGTGSSTTISDSEELIPVNVGYKSKNNNRNLNSITEIPLKNKNQSSSKQKNVEIEDDDEVEGITDFPPPNDKVEPTTKRPIIDNVSDSNQERNNGTVEKKDIEIIKKSYVPTINRHPTKVVMENPVKEVTSSEEEAILESKDTASTPSNDVTTEQEIFNTSSTEVDAGLFGRSLKMKSLALCLLLVAAVCALPKPQREGAAYTKEAIKQAQSTYLIPKDAVIQKVEEGIELAAYESIPGNQKINLFEILGDQLPSEVINNLQNQVNHVGQ